jgi:hypothetical protein
MRRAKWLVVGLLICATASLAEDKPNPDQLKKAYDDALVQLKSAQDSKNTLAKQNAELTRQVEELKKQLAGSAEQVQELRRQVADNDEKTFELRSLYAAWKSFMHVHPDLLVQWKLFLADDALAAPREPLRLIDPNWLLLDTQAQLSAE